MHSALDPKQLLRLPVSVRRLATAALKTTATAETIDRLGCRFEILETTRQCIPVDQADALLPICFVHLDPAAIPTPDDLDNISGDAGKVVFHTIARSIAAMRLLAQNIGSIPHETAPWLLPRVWLWFRFLDDHHELLWRAGLHVDFGKKTQRITRHDSPRMNALGFVFGLYADAEQANLSPAKTFRPMEGFAAVVGRALECVLRPMMTPIIQDSAQLEDDGWRITRSIFRLIGLFDLRHAATLSDLAGGAGGIQELADLMIFMLRLTMKESESATRIPPEESYLMLRLLLLLVDGSTGMYWASPFEAEFSLPKVPLTALSTTLVRRGIIPALVEALGLPHILKLRAFAVNAYRDSLRVLLRLLYQEMGTPYFDGALDSINGLLLILVGLCPLEVLLPIVRELFDTVLSGAVFYHHTAVKLREGIAALESAVSTPQFLESETCPIWRAFIERVSPSLGILEQQGLSLAACDNLACGRIDSKTAFRRCSACQAVYYCATTCQEADWEDGHRDSCSARPPWVLASHLQQAFPYHDRWFLRALLHHHYEEHLGQILLAHVEHLVFTSVAGTMETPRVMVFDFIVPAQPTFTVYSALDKKLPLRPRTTDADAEWSGIVRRAEASGGRMMLHLLRLRHRGAPRTLLIPLRLPSTTIGDALKEMASRIIESPSVEDRNKVHEMVEAALALRLPELWEERGIH
ncbi:hypothetical protein C8F01DRAFT_1242035 [Mycena amicta]|nr:hypothetical protein C8F01DRAFT_1242035 [Mycena amicta]